MLFTGQWRRLTDLITGTIRRCWLNISLVWIRFNERKCEVLKAADWGFRKEEISRIDEATAPSCVHTIRWDVTRVSNSCLFMETLQPLWFGYLVTLWLIGLWWSVQPLVTVCSPPEGKHRTRYQRIHLNWILKQVQLKSIRKKWNRRIKVFVSLKVPKVTLPAQHETEEHLVYLPCWY